jgi:low affinity Fe/Cu permease
LTASDRHARSAFDRFAEAATEFVSSGAFFVVSVVVVALWIPTIFLFESVDTWQLVINTATSVLAFLLVALLQNSERRYDRALHEKVDALARAVADLMEHDAREREELRRHAAELREAVKLEERI